MLGNLSRDYLYEMWSGRDDKRHIVDVNHKWIDYIYTCLVADGAVLSFVIFTNDNHMSNNMEGDTDGKVIYIPNLSKTP